MGDKICSRSKTKDILEPEYKPTQKLFCKPVHYRSRNDRYCSAPREMEVQGMKEKLCPGDGQKVAELGLNRNPRTAPHSSPVSHSADPNTIRAAPSFRLKESQQLGVRNQLGVCVVSIASAASLPDGVSLDTTVAAFSITRQLEPSAKALQPQDVFLLMS